MANTNAPFGLRFLGLSGGSAAPTCSTINAQLVYNAAAIYYGDPVMMQADGTILRWSPTTGVSQLWGVFQGCQYLGNNGSWTRGIYWPGSGAASGTANIVCDIVPCIGSPPPLFVIQTDSTGITQADVGQNADVAIGTGVVPPGRSGAYLNHSTYNTTATLPFRIQSLWADNTVPNAPGTQAGAYNWAVVTANVQQSTGI